MLEKEILLFIAEQISVTLREEDNWFKAIYTVDKKPTGSFTGSFHFFDSNNTKKRFVYLDEDGLERLKEIVNKDKIDESIFSYNDKWNIFNIIVFQNGSFEGGFSWNESLNISQHNDLFKSTIIGIYFDYYSMGNIELFEGESWQWSKLVIKIQDNKAVVFDFSVKINDEIRHTKHELRDWMAKHIEKIYYETNFGLLKDKWVHWNQITMIWNNEAFNEQKHIVYEFV